MSTALPVIDQAGKPAGVAGLSRDDLDAFTGPGTEIQFADAGVGGAIWAWTLVDQPPGAAASLVTPALATTLLTGATIPGSYLVQLVVDAGGVGQVYQIEAGVQVDLPSWMTFRLRIPAKGETTQFNVQSSPGVGANTRGWAEEMDSWFRAIANYGFGVAVEQLGAPFGTEPFYTLDFGAGFTLVDAGGGVLQLSTTGLGDLWNKGVLLAGGPWSVLETWTPYGWTPAVAYDRTMNAEWAPSGVAGRARLVGTAGHHQDNLHDPFILNSTNSLTTSLQVTINAGVNPMILNVAGLAVGDYAVTTGRVLSPAEITVGPLVNPVLSTPPSLQAVKLAATGVPYLRQVGAPAVWGTNLIIVDVDPTLPDGNYVLDYNAGTTAVRFNAGFWTAAPAVQGYVRLYDPDGHWVVVYAVVALVNASDTWTMAPSVLRNGEATLALAPYYDDVGTGLTMWGTMTANEAVNPQLLDTRVAGSIAERQLQDSAIARIDLLGADKHFDVGVVFDRNNSKLGMNYSVNSFGLTTVGATFPEEGTEIQAGAVWIQGRRYELNEVTTIASLGAAPNLPCLIGVELTATGTLRMIFYSGMDIVRMLAMSMRFFASENADYSGGSKLCEYPPFVPLYYGTTNGASTGIIVTNRIDLRRDVAHQGRFTVAAREGVTSPWDQNTRPHAVIAQDPMLGVKCRAEYASVAAALAWHSAMTGTNNLTADFAMTLGIAHDSPQLCVRVVGDTLETFPIILWRNVEIKGEGDPIVRIYSSTLYATANVNYLCIGMDNAICPTLHNHLVHNVTLRDFTLIADGSSAGGGAEGAINVYIPSYNAAVTPTFAGRVVTTLQHVLIENIHFASVNINPADYIRPNWSCISFIEALAGNCGMQFVTIRGCTSGKLCSVVPGTPNFHVGVRLSDLKLALFSTDLVVEGCSWVTTDFGIRSVLGVGTASTIPWRTVIRDNDIMCLGNDSPPITAVGICLESSCIETSIENNWIQQGHTQDTVAIQLGSTAPASGTAIVSVCHNTAVMFRNFLGQNVPATSGIVLLGAGPNIDVRISDNYFMGMFTGVFIDGPVDLLRISNNMFKEMQLQPNDGTYSSGVKLTAGSSNVAVSHNEFKYYNRGVEFDDTTEIVVDHNHIIACRVIAGRPSMEATGVLGSAEVGPVQIQSNTIELCRTGVYIEAVDPKGLVVSDNYISNYVDSTHVEGNLNSRCVYLKILNRGPITRADHRVVINHNQCSNFIAASAVDTEDACAGIYVNATYPIAPATPLNSVQIMGNQINTSSAAAATADFATKVFGVVVHGGAADLVIADNQITNTAVQLRGTATGGICYFNDVSNDPLKVSISRNTVRWVSCCYDAGDLADKAGILVNGYAVNIVINDNDVVVQTGEATAGDVGYISGILVGTSANSTENVSVCNNTIHGQNITATIPGTTAVGSAIWLKGMPVTQCSVRNNTIQGVFKYQLNPPTEPVSLGIISVAIINNENHYYLDVDSNKLVVSSDAGGLGGSSLAAGIMIGNADQLLLTSRALTVRNNYLNVYVDSSAVGDGPDLYTGGIVVVSLSQSIAHAPDCAGNIALIAGNYVNRSDVRVGGGDKSAHGIFISGWNDATIVGNHVAAGSTGVAAHGMELEDYPGWGATQSDVWQLNRIGEVGGAGCYVSLAGGNVVTGANNWRGDTTAFF